jgi:hypothetical protein
MLDSKAMRIAHRLTLQVDRPLGHELPKLGITVKEGLASFDVNESAHRLRMTATGQFGYPSRIVTTDTWRRPTTSATTVRTARSARRRTHHFGFGPSPGGAGVVPYNSTGCWTHSSPHPSVGTRLSSVRHSDDAPSSNTRAVSRYRRSCNSCSMRSRHLPSPWATTHIGSVLGVSGGSICPFSADAFHDSSNPCPEQKALGCEFAPQCEGVA